MLSHVILDMVLNVLSTKYSVKFAFLSRLQEYVWFWFLWFDNNIQTTRFYCVWFWFHWFIQWVYKTHECILAIYRPISFIMSFWKYNTICCHNGYNEDGWVSHTYRPWHQNKLGRGLGAETPSRLMSSSWRPLTECCI